MKKYRSLLSVLTLVLPIKITALTFSIPPQGDIVGALQYAYVQQGESLGDIGKRFDIGVYEMIEANPSLNPWIPKAGAKVIVPSQFILPPGPRKGMIINLAEMRLYYYVPGKNQVATHPIGIGKKGWRTPLGKTRITQMTKNPTWRPPKSIRESHAKKGEYLPLVVPPGPDNPLGKYAMRLAMPGYLIHGTNRAGGVGVRSSSGCIRLFPADIESLFYKVRIGTNVDIVHEPYKFGYLNNKLYVESHEPLSDPYYNKKNTQTKFYQALEAISLGNVFVDSREANRYIENAIGYPTLLN